MKYPKYYYSCGCITKKSILHGYCKKCKKEVTLIKMERLCVGCGKVLVLGVKNKKYMQLRCEECRKKRIKELARKHARLKGKTGRKGRVETKKKKEKRWCQVCLKRGVYTPVGNGLHFLCDFCYRHPPDDEYMEDAKLPSYRTMHYR